MEVTWIESDQLHRIFLVGGDGSAAKREATGRQAGRHFPQVGHLVRLHALASVSAP
jgi:hypothetical protein